MSLKLKICGMREPTNVAGVAALQPDYLGFIFYDKSPRFVGLDFKLPALPADIQKVGVFVNEKTDTIVAQVDRHQLDWVQLHGTESAEACRELQSAGVKVIKAFSVDASFDFASVEPFKNYVRYFLFDTKGKYFGGNSKTFDWNLLKMYDQEIPFFLSGGLTPENVSDIRDLQQLNIHALDVNSGVEDAPGLKNINKIQAIKNIINSW